MCSSSRTCTWILSVQVNDQGRRLAHSRTALSFVFYSCMCFYSSFTNAKTIVRDYHVPCLGWMFMNTMNWEPPSISHRLCFTETSKFWLWGRELNYPLIPNFLGISFLTVESLLWCNNTSGIAHKCFMRRSRSENWQKFSDFIVFMHGTLVRNECSFLLLSGRFQFFFSFNGYRSKLW